ncbi:unnamed protein product [Polarella glacialis]|uniref:Uncharacterized protein n=1 Tax=Polarella glacialis TaxID=89957 RepID=A0A813GTB9_POLGL|nr:unnamed protein product [Polarella glacialis]
MDCQNLPASRGRSPPSISRSPPSSSRSLNLIGDQRSHARAGDRLVLSARDIQRFFVSGKGLAQGAHPEVGQMSHNSSGASSSGGNSTTSNMGKSAETMDSVSKGSWAGAPQSSSQSPSNNKNNNNNNNNKSAKTPLVPGLPSSLRCLRFEPEEEQKWNAVSSSRALEQDGVRRSDGKLSCCSPVRGEGSAVTFLDSEEEGPTPLSPTGREEEDEDSSWCTSSGGFATSKQTTTNNNNNNNSWMKEGASMISVPAWCRSRSPVKKSQEEGSLQPGSECDSGVRPDGGLFPSALKWDFPDQEEELAALEEIYPRSLLPSPKAAQAQDEVEQRLHASSQEIAFLRQQLQRQQAEVSAQCFCSQQLRRRLLQVRLKAEQQRGQVQGIPDNAKTQAVDSEVSAGFRFADAAEAAAVGAEKRAAVKHETRISSVGNVQQAWATRTLGSQPSSPLGWAKPLPT